MKRTHVFALCSSLVLAACGGGGGETDIEGTLVFAERTDLEISRLISAAGGTDMFMVEGQLDQFGDTFDPDPCPTIAIDGDTATITGGCTTADGVTISGSGTVVNPFSWDQLEYQQGDDSLYEAHGLTFTQTGFEQTMDGFVRRPSDFSTWDADVTVTQTGVGLRSDLYYHCSNPSSPSCSVSGSGLELVGVGGATVSGKVKINIDTGETTADYTMKGVDTLTVHLTRTCIEWQVEGTDRHSVCTN